MPELYILEDKSPNAFATGRSPKKSAIVITRGLLEIMNKEELEGVLAHELAHIQNRDTLLMTTVVVMFGIVAVFLDFMLNSFMYGNNRANPFIIIGVYLLTFLVLSLIRFSISRRREYQADTTAALYTRYPEGLASALRKIKEHSRPMKVSSSVAHLFISNPVMEVEQKSKTESKLFGLFDTHPPIDKRIDALLKTK